MYSTPFHRTDLSSCSFLVTGAAGFIGSNIIEYLLNYGAGKVIAMDNFITGNVENINEFSTYKNFEFIEGDIRNYNDCLKASSGIDFVCHQAALGSVPRSIIDPVTTTQININGFVNILLACKENKIKRLVYASSSAVYGDSESLPKVENKTGNPLSPYAITKANNEQFADVFSKLFSLEIIGLRYFNVFGPRQNPEGPYAAVVPLFVTALLKNEAPFIFGDGTNSRDFTFIENAVQANILAMFTNNKSSINQVYNVAVGEATSLKKLYELINGIVKTNIHVIFKEPRPGDIKDSLADISKAKKLLNYSPGIKIKQGLELTVEWFKKQVTNNQ